MTVANSKTTFYRKGIHLEQWFLNQRMDVKHNHFREVGHSTALTPLPATPNSQTNKYVFENL